MVVAILCLPNENADLVVGVNADAILMLESGRTVVDTAAHPYLPLGEKYVTDGIYRCAESAVICVTLNRYLAAG